MTECMAEIGVAVIGGDRRQSRVVQELVNRVAWVRGYGVKDLPVSPRVKVMDELESTVSGADIILFPISGVSSKGMVRSGQPDTLIALPEEFWLWLEPGCLVVTGSLPEILREKANQNGIRVVEYAELDEVAIPNAIPTAEGAIQLAMEAIPVTLHGNPCLILGYGRVAQALAKMLIGIGAQVYVAARNPVQLQRAAEAGCITLALQDLEKMISTMCVIFNSVPAIVLTRKLISLVNKEAIIIDLASAPGGTDFEAANEYGVKAVLALGLPGKVAPCTAGEILASTLPDLMERELAHWAAWEARQ